jgi:metal-responsive CopG/Arc/MetJ family transcriptional regulator
MLENNRFSVRMSDSLAQELEDIQTRTGYSRAQIFSRAISLYKIAKIAQMNKEEVIIRSDTKEKELVSI